MPERGGTRTAGETAAVVPLSRRPRVDGKFLAAGDERLWLRGVTYGTFAPDRLGARFGSPAQVRADFAAMAAIGLNAVRTYTAPPRWFLDDAARHGLRVMVGLAWEQHIAFLDERWRAAAIEAAVRSQAAECAGHPAVLCFSVGNEIPTPVVRWHGRRRVERFIEHLCNVVRVEDPGALLTYVNYPSTEYLRLPFLDFSAFNIYLDDEPAVARYLARLQNLAGEKPLVVAELGADSRRRGRHGQARTVASQVRTAASAGCAGTFVFSWTDEWHRGDDDVLDWHFGLTDRARRPKPAHGAVAAAYTGFERAGAEPDAELISVVVCTHNGEARLRGCLTALTNLRYPAYETIVVDDGSTDSTAEIAADFDVRLIRTENQGLSAARNVGLAAARGEIVAYTDDDARPDPDWLRFLAIAFRETDHAAIGGPNLPPPEDGPIASCVANAPGGPVHVLLSDTEAEHIPGCNMAFRRADLLRIGGFDSQFRVAGDDVDVCWRLQAQGATLGFHPAAVVWHHRRPSIRAYWRQQRGYGHAEALLERKWPEKYTRRGHLTWQGRLYGRARTRVFRPVRIYHGTWGSGAFQPADEPRPGVLVELIGAPDWYLLLAAFAGIAALGLIWTFFAWSLAALALAVAASLTVAVAGGLHADLGRHGRTRRDRIALRSLTACLHLLQPAARLVGRLSQGLSPWRQRRTAGVTLPRQRVRVAWHEAWEPALHRVGRVERVARASGARVVRGGPYSSWDLEVSGGALGAARLLMVVEEHGRERQLVRSRIWPRVTGGASRALLVLGAFAVACAVAGRPYTAIGSLAAAVLVALVAAWECGLATAALISAVDASDSALSRRPQPQEAPASTDWNGLRAADGELA